MAHLISPSILAGDFNNLQKEIKMLNSSVADWVHLDIMDGVFVPNISFGLPVVSAIHKISTKPLDVHLMIVEPDRYIEEFYKSGANILTVHLEASTHLHRTIYKIKEKGMKAGVAINPHTSPILLEPIINDLDLVCLMTVNPGFYGQHFIETSYSKLKQLKELIISKGSNALIEVDGGVNGDNASQLISLGADVLVAGGFVFGSQNPIEEIRKLKLLN